MIQDAKDYFYHLHDIVVNQKYNKTLPYSFHLEMVSKQAEKFIHLIPDETIHSTIMIAVYGHDSIEDARITYNDVKELFGEDVAEIIYLCSEDKGRNRAERKSDVWYHQIAKNKYAVFVKLCDIIANSLFSTLSNSSMLKKYKQEYIQKVKPSLYSLEYKEMFDYLDNIYKL
jgi:(p)ppGpp synthase/HD superfamily hydrolase